MVRAHVLEIGIILSQRSISSRRFLKDVCHDLFSPNVHVGIRTLEGTFGTFNQYVRSNVENITSKLCLILSNQHDEGE